MSKTITTMLMFGVMLTGATDTHGADATEKLLQAGLSSREVVFTENQGQWDDEVRFRADVDGGSVWLTGDAVLFHFNRSTEDRRRSARAGLTGEPFSKDIVNAEPIEFLNVLARIKGAVANPRVRVSDPVNFKTHYYIGAERSSWHTNVSSYREVTFEDVYPGIDVRYYSQDGQIEYDFIVSPGVDPSVIEIEYDGVKSVSVNDDGQIEVETEWGKMLENAPVSFQREQYRILPVASAFVQKSDRSFGFKIEPEFDSTKPLVIDPVISFSTYIAGTSFDFARDVTVDGDGNIYVTGDTYGLRSQYWPDYILYGVDRWNDIFVLKMSPAGVPLFLAYIGGESADYGEGIDVDTDGNIYLAGWSWSTTYPRLRAYRDYNAGSQDAVVTAIGAGGDTLIYSTYLGGSELEMAYDIAVDRYGEAVVIGRVDSDDFPVQNALVLTSPPGVNAFVTKFKAVGHTLVYSTYLGGNSWDEAEAVAVDDQGMAYVTGWTHSGTFPIINALQPDKAGFGDAFLSKIDSSGSSFLFSTFFGGQSSEYGSDVILDDSNMIYVAGRTGSSDLPLVNPYQSVYAGDEYSWDAFVSTFSNDGDSVVYCTFLGGTLSDYAYSLDVDSSGNIYVTGFTESDDFPTVVNWMPKSADSGFVFVTRINASGTSLDYSTYLGRGQGYGIAVTPSGDAAVCGWTRTGMWPVYNAQQPLSQSPDYDGFLINVVSEGFTDTDGDWVDDAYDNCPGIYNLLNPDRDNDGIGDTCDVCPDDSLANIDGDDVEVCIDNCPDDYNPGQSDSDGDGVGDACDLCPGVADGPDSDEDGTPDGCDECTDTDGDGYGDPGFAANTCPDDNCPDNANEDQLDTDGDGIGDVCDSDVDGDGFDEGSWVWDCWWYDCGWVFVYFPCSGGDTTGGCHDNCPEVYNPDQSDQDGDGIGDVCDICIDDPQNDFDGDSLCADVDNCPYRANPGQEDTDGDGIGDACCCVTGTGNVDNDPDDICDIGDLTALIGYLFIPPFEQPACPNEANVDGSGVVDIGDLTALISYLFIPPFTEPAACQ